MTSDFVYSPDGKTLTASSYGDRTVTIPVEVIDFLNSVHIGEHLMDNIKAYRSLTVLEDGLPVSEPSIVPASSLVGVDLRNKIVRVFHANYEDSEWLETGSALTVRDESGGYCSFVFEKQYEDWYNNLDDDPEMYDKIPYDVERLLNFGFYSTSSIWVADKKPV